MIYSHRFLWIVPFLFIHGGVNLIELISGLVTFKFYFFVHYNDIETNMTKRSHMSRELTSSNISQNHGAQNETSDDTGVQPSTESIGASKVKVRLLLFLYFEFSHFSFFHLVHSGKEYLLTSIQSKLQHLANAIMTRIFPRRLQFPHQSLKRSCFIRFPKFRGSAFIPQKFQTVVSYGIVLAAISTSTF
jgi:hypothetical protein